MKTYTVRNFSIVRRIQAYIDYYERRLRSAGICHRTQEVVMLDDQLSVEHHSDYTSWEKREL